MSEDLNTEIKIGADASGVEAGVSKAKRSLASLGQAADQAGKTGGEGLLKIGAGGEASARRVDQSTKSMIASIQRQTAAFEAGGTSARQYQEALARMRGIDSNVLKPYLDQLDAARAKADAAARAQAGLGTSLGGLGTVATLAKGALTGLLAGLSLGSMLAFVKNINDGVDGLNDLKDATGSSIENLSALEDVALRTGTSIDTVGAALVKFNQVLGDAKPGSTQAAALKAIGLSAEELRRLDPAEALRQTAVALSQFADDGDKARVVQELFGKSVKDVAPFLNDLAEKTKLVGTVTDEQRAEAEKLNKQLFEMQKNMLDLSRTMVGPMVTSINEVIKKFKEGRAAGLGFMSIGWQNYKDNVSSFYSGSPSNTGGATGEWDAPEAPKPSVGNIPDPAAAKAAADAARKSAEAARREMAEQAKIMAELSGLSGSFAEDWARLTTVYKAGKLSLEQYTQAQADLLAKQPGIKAAADAEIKARESILKASQLAADARNREAEGIAAWLQAQEAAAAQALNGVQSRISGLQDEERAVALAYGLNIALAEAIERVALARLEEKQAGFYEGSDGYLAIQKEIDARKELIELVRNKGVREAAAEADKKLASELARNIEQYDDIFRQGFADMLNRGEDGIKAFGKSLKTTVLTSVADALYKAFAQKFVLNIVGNVAGLIGLSGAANAATGGGGIMGNLQTASNLNTLFGAGSQALFGASAGASAASLGYANIVGMAGGDAIGALAAANGMWAGVATGAQAAAQAAIASNAAMAAGTAAALPAGTTAAAAGAGGAASTGALAAIPGWGWALAGVAALAGLGSLFGAAGTQEYGAVAQYSAASGTKTGKGGYEQNSEWYNFGTGFGGVAYNEGIATNVSGITQSIVTALDATAKTFGQTVGYEAAAGFASDFGDEATWGGLRIALQGMDLVNWNDNRQSKWAPKEFASGEEGYKQYLAAIAKDTRQVLLDMDLPSWADTMLESIGEAASMDQLSAALQQIGAIKATFEQLGKSIEGFAGITEGMETALLKAAGGIDALRNSAGTYYENFYSDAEKTAAVTRQVSDALASVGLQMPATREEFRALVESQIALGEGSAQAVAALLGVSGAFASVTASAGEAANAAIAAAKAQADAAAAQARDARSSALRALESAIARDKDALEIQRSLAADSISSLTDIFDTIRSNVRELRGEVESSASMQVAQANAYIDNALRAAQTTGYMPDGAVLSEAIGTARGGIASGAYVSQFDADRDRLVLAGKLSALGEITGEQLSTAERQLRRTEEQIDQLDATLAYWRTQIDIANGTYEAVLSVADAVRALQSLSQGGQQSVQPAGAGGAWEFGMGYATDPANFQQEFNFGRGRGSVDVSDPVKAGQLASIREYLQANYGTGSVEDLQKIADAAMSSGVTMADIGAALGFWEEDIRKIFAGAGIPAFAVGTNYVPRDMLARIHEGEAIVPKAYNPAAGGATGGGNAEMLAELRALREEVSQLRAATSATASNTAGLPQMADQFDSVTAGGSAMRNKAIA